MSQPESPDTVHAVVETPPRQLAAAPAAIAVSGLRKTYASGLTALRNIDLTIHRGEIFALLGPNGAARRP